MPHPNHHTDLYSHEKPFTWERNYERVKAWFVRRQNAPALAAEIIAGTGLTANEWHTIASKGKACFNSQIRRGKNIAGTSVYKLTEDEYLE